MDARDAAPNTRSSVNYESAGRSSLPLRAALPEALPSLRARARRLARTAADADDLVQETVLRALRFESTFERGTNLRAWMCRILDTVFITRCRSRSREYRALGKLAVDPTVVERCVGAPVLHSISNSMNDALRALPPQFLRVVELVDLRDHSYREAALELGIPVGTVMSRLFRARRLLEVALGSRNEQAVPHPHAKAA